MISFQEYLKNLGFNIHKYEVMSGLSDFELIEQLSIRDKYSNVVKGLLNEDHACFAGHVLGNSLDELKKMDFESDEFLKMVLDKYSVAHNNVTSHYINCFSNPALVIDDKYLGFYKYKDVYSGFVPNMMSYTDSVHPLSRISLEGFVFSKATIGVGANEPVMPTMDEISELDDHNNEKLFPLSNESVSLIASEAMRSGFNPEDFGYPMYLSVDVTKHDADILEDLARLLPIWRNELNIDAPSKKRSWGYIRGKIIDYKIFPLMDLLEVARIYTFNTKKRVPKRLLSLALYPDGERDGFGLDQTVIPFLEKIRGKSHKFLEEYKINKE